MKIFKTRDGKEFRKYTPAEKAKYFAEKLKRDNGHRLRKTQVAYYSGYLKARRDSADAYNYNVAKRSGTLEQYYAKRRARSLAEQEARRKHQHREIGPGVSFDVDDFFNAALKRTYGDDYIPVKTGERSRPGGPARSFDVDEFFNDALKKSMGDAYIPV